MHHQEIIDHHSHNKEAKPKDLWLSRNNGMHLIDTRKEVQNIQAFPSNIVGYFRIDFISIDDKSEKVVGGIHGSGVLIAPFTVLTCAHNFFPPTDEYAITKENITFSLAYHQHQGTQYRVEGFTISPFYIQQKENKVAASQQHDFAIVNLKKDNIFDGKVQTTYIWDVNHFKELTKDKENVEIQSFGYPSDKNIERLKGLNKKISQKSIIGYQFKSTGHLIAFDEQFLWHNMASEAGQSGSPIFYKNGQNLCLIGIHKGYNSQRKLYYGIPLWSAKSLRYLNDSKNG